MTITIVFVRHGRADNVEGRCVGHFDAPLSESGASAIYELAAMLSTMGITRITSSDLARARNSAAIIGAALDVPVTIDSRLREMHFGEWDGQTWADIETNDGERWRTWMESWTTVAPPGGEGIDDLARRADAWIADLRRDESLIVVSHAGFIRAALCRLLGRPIDTLFDIPIDHAHATVIELGEDGPTLLRTNLKRY